MAGTGSFRRSEYTGDNRCWPCTVLNLGIVGVIGVVVGLRSPLAGLAVALVGTGVVAVRGYVVPFTPRFAPAVTANLPVDVGHEVRDRDATGAHTGTLADDRRPDVGTNPDPEVVLADLADAGVLVGESDLVLDRSFERDWEAGMADRRQLDDEELAAATADAAPWDATGEPFEDRIRVRGTGRDVWLSRPAAIADTTAIEALVDAGVDPETAAAAARPLRMFLRECPACGGPVVETTRESCCGATAGSLNPAATVLACEDCEAELFELEPDPETDDVGT